MQIKNLFADKDAVSPVIGVILMVAITVILAAVIGAFVLGIGGSQEQVPQASWEWGQGSSVSSTYECATGNDTTVGVTHQGGDQVNTENLKLGGTDCATAGNGDEMTAGDTLTIGDASSGDTVTLVWASPSSDSSNILSEYEVS